MYKGTVVDDARTINYMEQIISDHYPTRAEITGMEIPKMVKGVKNLAVNHRCNQKVTEKAQKLYHEKIPQLTREIVRSPIPKNWRECTKG